MAQGRPRVLVTGGSSGIGFELARQFAEDGHDVTLAAQDVDKLEHSAELIRERAPDVAVDTIAADLASDAGVFQLHRTLKDAGTIDIFCANAGIGSGGGDFTETDLDQELRLIDLNVRGLVQLSKLVVRDMAARGEGRILYTASIAGIMPGPFEAVYAASKAFVRSFGEALRNELADKGIHVTVFMPGPTETDFFTRAHMENTPAGQAAKDDAAEVAAQAIEALRDDRHAALTGSLKTRVQGQAAKWLSDPARAAVHRKQTEPLDREPAESGGLGPAAIGGLFFVGALAAAGTAMWLQSRDEDSRRIRERGEPKADFEVAGTSF
ncbi:SDR family NAD(P)-dependent oxidoreductase [Sphingomonas sp.]|uniref:SDR family NAD(P)-dependent oxidoreductase n=1 Tax=Sphingomonas sp. TaxID=28214 RepID=UPI002DBDD828|nr:SDR family NAD(P)-dependent oxidoreductase [Sphingomonas sp.]HEU4968264.1 SDR family NAD(P)-dependent oxidoreductase [Sphingomonas sp.]